MPTVVARRRDGSERMTLCQPDKRRTLRVWAKNLTDACLKVEATLRPGDKYFRHAEPVGKPGRKGDRWWIFSDEKVTIDAA